MEFLKKLGKASTGPGHVYLTGGASAVLIGWRSTTIDIDLKFEPAPPGGFQAIAQLKDELEINVELAAPDEFIPALQGWKDRSRWIETYGQVSFYHYDFYAQALAKIERGLAKDLGDVREMVAAGLVVPSRLLQLFENAKEDLLKYPAIDAESFEAEVVAFVNLHATDP